ncbi:hypothetical protein F6U93_08855 [Tamlana haliotis]|uniref:Uncharacterized protein n=1 Tax=Pseudotamlana haliotis TaxID=2614804 RepID=A0A6N6MHR3_9FLAO|nr:hypothetical protein [Tamlana haliotis]KAB1067707.1 hypothetical protein F6U93_08855 [Tamlana haliotis]
MNIKTSLTFTFIALLLTVTFSCKKENTFNNYEYADQPETITCEGINTPLLKEALYSFEKDIFMYYKKNRPKNRLNQAYNRFLRDFSSNRLKYKEIVRPHTLEVFEALKKEKGLWDANNPVSHLNYNSNLITCIGDNIKDEALKTTFNALLETNSLTPKLYSAAASSKYRSALNDKYLASYIAFDLYYAKLFDVDLSRVNKKTPNEPVDFNQIPE